MSPWAPKRELTILAVQSEFRPERIPGLGDPDGLAEFPLAVQGTFFKSFLCGWISAAVLRTRSQRGVTQVMQELIDGSDLAKLAELFRQNPLHVLAAQRADTILGTGSRIQPRPQAIRFLGGQ